MTTKDINEAIGINGAYVALECKDGQHRGFRVTRARKTGGVLQFRILAEAIKSQTTWRNAPEDWELKNGYSKVVARHDW